MNQEKFDRQLKIKENILIVTMLIPIVAALGWMVIQIKGFWDQGSTDIDMLVSGTTPIICLVLFLNLASKYFPATILKEYWIEDTGTVVKLHGGFRIIHSSKARRDLLSTRPGLMIVEDAYEKYKCTLAAVPASAEALKAKEELAELGFEQHFVS